MKSLELIFSIFNTLILPQWILMIFAPRWKWTLWLVSSYLIPIAIGIAYAFLVLPNLFGSGQMPDFGTLDGIKNLFKMGNDEVVVGGWFHYLAFDLLVGSWILTDSQKNKVKHWLVAPCLFFTLMAGPVGFVLYQIINFISPKTQKQA
ncbi:MAG: hypothetical protein OHK0057_16270 [Thermoflexibacter sp.]